MILLLAACGPHVERGVVGVEAERAPPPITEIPSIADALTIELELAVGSREDPVGREGTAWAVAHAVGIGDVAVGSSTTTFRVTCPTDEIARCAEPLAAVATLGEPHPDAALRALDALAVDEGALLAAIARARATGDRPPAGRRSTVPTLNQAELAAFHARTYRRARASVRVDHPLAPEARARLLAALERLPGGFPTGESALSPNRGDPPPVTRIATGPDLVWLVRPEDPFRPPGARIAVTLPDDAVRAAVPDATEVTAAVGVSVFSIPEDRVGAALEALRAPLGTGTAAVAAGEVPAPGWAHVGRVTPDAFLR